MKKVVENVLNQILTLALPSIKKLIESKVVPALKRRCYEHLDNFATDRIEDLSKLLEKIKTTDDSSKKTAHMEGFMLGLEAIEAIGQKLIEAANTLKEQI